ncbi:hypothetical protein F4821DRAFT_227609 [Hypoxylon rubiginosum]|uniref:Uncharacterized protein n=1 Tax=Hypoxylon rubiginosum TaxID=110542 RepID=A0ACC0DER7_9PEZI|nr:hypothetical protein F4821DRAFT_227609 [Hypoxylon rubiginosum]
MDEEYYYNMNYHNKNDVPQAEADADAFESEERDPRMRETRRILREDWRLSANTKTVLLLVTQIPEGCWTNITTLQKHIALHMKTRRGLRALASNPTFIEKALAENWLGNDRVPCHRVVGGFCYPTIWVAGHVHDPELLLVEGVRLGAGQVPLGKPWDGFSGCPKATKVLLVRN